MITGKTLIDLGFEPAKWFGEAIEKANRLALNGENLVSFLEDVEKENKIETLILRDGPVYHVENITVETTLEKENISSVRKTMEGIMRIPVVVSGLIMPDACPTGEYSMPVGAVVGSSEIHPGFHSADVCCSIYATEISSIKNVKEFMDIAYKTTHMGPGGRKRSSGMFKLLPETLLKEIKQNSFTKEFEKEALSHFITQGDGNHFLFLGKDSLGKTYLVSHHGSRGFGAKVYKKGLALAKNLTKKICPEVRPEHSWIPWSDGGEEYWNALEIVKSWTMYNHMNLHQLIIEKAKCDIIDNIWTPHNFVFKDGGFFWHAKGSTPMFGDRALIPMNMRDGILIAEGKSSCGFAPHGAGRNLSRAAFKKTVEDDVDLYLKETEGIDVRFKFGIDVSELPSAYKGMDSIVSDIKKYNLGNVVDVIKPLGCVMAGQYQRK